MYKIDKKTYDEIDEDLRDIMVELNKKNYGTVMCCQGHVDKVGNTKHRCDGFIRFADNFDFNLPFLGGKDKNEQYCTYDTRSHIYKWYSSAFSSFEQKEKERKEWVKTLEMWVGTLPKRDICTEYIYVAIGKSKRTNKDRIFEHWTNKEQAYECLPNLKDRHKGYDIEIKESVCKRY